MDQGLGVGSKLPFFNRHQVTLTRFIQLQPEDKVEIEKPPLVGVVHARYGGCVGDLASYDAFTLGGPYSVRGYNMGELGAARNFLEVTSLPLCCLASCEILSLWVCSEDAPTDNYRSG